MSVPPRNVSAVSDPPESLQPGAGSLCQPVGGVPGGLVWNGSIFITWLWFSFITVSFPPSGLHKLGEGGFGNDGCLPVSPCGFKEPGKVTCGRY